MKYSIRHLLAMMLAIALAIQAGRACRIRQHVRQLEQEHDHARMQLRNLEESRRHEYELCQQVVDAYEYPGDYAAAERRFARLNSGDPEHEQRPE
jgi:hypothetical protein